MAFLVLIVGMSVYCLLAVPAGIVGSRRRIGFGIPFLVSLIFTPLVGTIIALLSAPLPREDRRWRFIDTLCILLGASFLTFWLVALANAVAAG